MVQIEAPGVETLKVKKKYKLSEPGCWAIEVSGRKDRNDGLSVLLGEESLKGQERLLPAENQKAAEKVEPSKDTCRYGQFQERFQIEMKFKKPDATTVGPVKGIFYLLFEEEEESEDETEQQS